MRLSNKLLAVAFLLNVGFAQAQTINSPTCLISSGTITCPTGSLTPPIVSGNTLTIGTSTLTLGASKTVNINNSLTFAGNDGATLNIGAGGTIAPFTIGGTTIVSGTDKRIIYDNNGFVGEYTLTGGGTVVAMQSSPSFITPSLGVAAATSISINGATQGANVLAISGGTVTDGTLNLSSTTGTAGIPTLAFTADSNLGIYRSQANVISIAAANTRTIDFDTTGILMKAANHIAWGVPGTSFAAGFWWNGTSLQARTGNNAADAPFTSSTLILSSTTDAASSTGGALQVPGGASVAKRFWIPAISASAGLQTAVLCQSSGGEMIADSVACLASSSRFKNIIGPLPDGALAKLSALKIERWSYKPEGILHDKEWTRERVGPIAEDVAAMDQRLAGYDVDGRVRSYSTEQLLAFTIKAIQEQQAQIISLQSVRR